MARDPKHIKGVPLMPGGMNDNNPLEAENSFYQTRGVHSISERALQRCNGKLLLNKFPSPILAIHGDLASHVFVETTTAIYIFADITDPIPLPLGAILGDDDDAITGDDGLFVTE